MPIKTTPPMTFTSSMFSPGMHISSTLIENFGEFMKLNASKRHELHAIAIAT
jgi:hypothetical protein